MSIDVNVQNDLVIVTETTEDIVVNVSNAAGPQGPAGPAGVGVPVGGTIGQVLKKFTNTNYDTYWAADASGLTSVGLSVPTGLTVTNSPLTTNGTLAVGLESGYSIPTTASQTTWNTAYNDSIVSAAVTGTTTKTLTLNQQDGGSVTASWSDLNTDAVTSVFGRTGAVIATEGDYTLTQLGDVTLTSPTNGQVLKYNGTTWVNNTDTDTGLTSVGLSMPSAFNVANSPLTSNGTLAVTGAGLATQYIRGDGQLATFPSTASGGSSVNYYLNGSVNASVAGYKQLDNNAIVGGGTDFTLVGNGLIAQFLTDAGNPNRIQIPGGAWNFEMYFQVSSAGGNQKFYIELHKYDGSTFSLIASSSAVPEEITGGTSIDLYLTSLAVPTTTLLTTDRLAIRVYIVDNAVGRTITLHTENTTLCEIITTFSGGVSSLNGLSANTQYFATGTSGTDFNINSVTDTHTFNLPTASATNRGALSSADWTTFNSKQDALNGTGFVKISGTTISYDNSTYYLASNPSAFIALTALTATAPLSYNNTTGAFTIAQSSGSVNGFLSSTDWTTFNNKQNTITNPVTGTGTTNYLPKWTSGSAIGNSLVFDNGTNVGIGTASPGVILDIASSGTGIVRVKGGNSTNQGAAYYVGGNTVTLGAIGDRSAILGGTPEQAFSIYTGTVPLLFDVAAAERMRITSSGLVGIGTTNPNSNGGSGAGLLHINGAAAGAWAITHYTNGTTGFTESDGFIVGSIGADAYIFNYENSPILFGTNSSERLRITSGGNLLVGTTTDTGEKLQVNGAATFSSSVTATSFIKSGGTSSQYLMADGSVSTGGGGGSVDELQVALLSQVYG